MIKDFNSKEFKEQFHYNGNLGATYSEEKTIFNLWSPLAEKVVVKLYDKGNKSEEIELYEMIKDSRGVWSFEKMGDCHGLYYVYYIHFEDKINRTVDPYAKALGVNGERAMVVDLERTNPEKWKEDRKPAYKDATDSIIYEAHVRDMSIDENSGVSLKHKGKFLGLVEEGTVIPSTKVTTSLEHLKELGITHIHLLPSFDYGTVDEAKLDVPQFNWGYDPTNYNVPEGSYSTNPFAGEVRIKEFKEMVQAFHKNGIRVIMDVVYNHTLSGENSNLNLSMPGYYHRQDEKGGFSDGSGCGNELASERSMVRRYMVESVLYWAQEYHVDGFRFDLMALHDIETIKIIRQELNKIDDTIIVYGEGWTGGASPLPEVEACFKKNTKEYEELQIAAFSDDIRDGIKGHVAKHSEPGFVNGKKNFEETIKFGVVASTYHKDIDYSNINYSEEYWANEPYQTITYCSAHDNYTIWDKLQVVSPSIKEDELIKLNKLAAAIVLTSQGISFVHAGEELARTKIDEKGEFVENSFKSSDKVNKIDWTRKIKYKNIFEYYKGLIELRKANKGFRLGTSKEIQQYISFFTKGKEFNENNVVAYHINGQGNLDGYNNIVVIHNANYESVNVKLPEGTWNVVVNGQNAGIKTLAQITTGTVKVEGKSSFVLVK